MNVLTFIIILIVLFILFLLVRELMCWYWKINDIVKILLRIESKLSNVTENGLVKNQEVKSTANDFQSSVPKSSNENSNVLVKNQQNDSALDSSESRESRPEAEQNLMKKYGIKYENEKYHYKSYQYDTLENAINYAKLCEERGIK
jgi:hypothetical protein